MEQTNIQYQSEFLPNVTIVTVFDDDKNYHELEKYFKIYGYGFMVPNKNLVIIDGEKILELDGEGVLKFIEAHEISHVLLNHSGPRSEEEELDADLGAYILLKKNGYEDSIKILLDNFEDRHGIEFSEDLVNKFSKNVDF